MKNYIILVLIIFYSCLSLAQSGCTCLPEGIEFNNQFQIDSFPINYSGCNKIQGNVFIVGDDIVNLSGLSALTSIGGDLQIGYEDGYGNSSLISLTGLDNLMSIGGSLEIYSNDALTSLTGLDNLNYLGENLRIGYDESGNNALTSLTGLEGLTSIGGSLIFWGNDALTSLSALDNLTSIGGNLGFGITMH